MNNHREYRKLLKFLLVLGDILLVPLIYYFSYWLRSKTTLFFFQERMPSDRIHWVTHYLGILTVLHVTILYFHALYDQLSNYSNNQIIGRCLRSVSLEILIFVSIYFFSQNVMYPRSIIILLWLLLFIATSAWHIYWQRTYFKQLPERNLLIVGVNDSTLRLLHEIERLPSYQLKVVGLLTREDDNFSGFEFMGYPILGTRDDLLDIVNKYDIHEVVLSTEGSWRDSLINQISKIDKISARICIIPSCYEILIGKINHLRLYDIPLLEVIKHPRPQIGKRLMDFVVALILIFLTAPVFLFTIIAILLTSGRPIFFTQTRIGENRKPFTIYKFRTLIPNAENETGPVLSDENDERVTKIGRFLRKYRIDELPQLFNILKGDMSFVGPRPERQFFVDKYINTISGYGERFKATPGLTGLAQVNGGYATTPENKLKYDLAYIYNQSFWIDLRIMLETIKVILSGRVNP